MTRQRTNAETLAVCLEYDVIDVAEAVAWADMEIAASDVPHIALCDVAMASRSNSLDVANILRLLPGVIDDTYLIRGVITKIAAALRSGRRSPQQVASVLFQLSLEDVIPPGALLNDASWFYDAIDLAEGGYIEESPEQVVKRMQQTLDRWLKEFPNE